MGRPKKIAPGVGERLASLYPGEHRKVFAEHLGIPDGTLGNYERGDRLPDWKFLVKLREIKGVDINWLLTGNNTDNNTFPHDQIETKNRLAEPFNEDKMKKIAAGVKLYMAIRGKHLEHSKYSDVVAAIYEADLDDISPTSIVSLLTDISGETGKNE